MSLERRYCPLVIQAVTPRPVPSNRRNVALHGRILALFLLAASLQTGMAHAQAGTCAAGIAVDHAFESGAAWSLCVDVAQAHGLSITSAHYRAPGDSLRSVLRQAHLGQLLLHYHDSTLPDVQIDPALHQEMADGSSELLVMNTNTCKGTVLGTSQHSAAICTRIKDNRILAKYAQRPGIQSQSLELASTFQRDTLTWTSSFSFTEDGTIRPAVSLSGRASRTQADARFAQAIPAESMPLTRATILANWRLVFDLDTPDADRVEQFEFPLEASEGNRRPMSVTVLDTEQRLYVDREKFRGWRIVDSSGAGYYLDPANNGFSYRNISMPWARADGAVTAFKDCERHAWSNLLSAPSPQESTSTCGSSLDEFVNGQTLPGVQPVLWYSQSRTLDPRIEDWPVIRDLNISFDLLPYDWTPASPFEAAQ